MFILSCAQPDLVPILGVIRNVFDIVKIIIPIALILAGTFDLGKAIMAGDEKEIKAATQIMIKRVVAGVAVFLIVTIVMLVTGLVGGDDWKDCWAEAKEATISDLYDKK